MPKYGLLIDYGFCTGCHSCEFACRQEHNLPVGQWGIQVAQVGPWQIKDDEWQYAYVPIPTDQCTLCGRRRARGQQPSCVQHCQANVIRFGPVEELAQQVMEKPRQVLFVPR